MVHRDSQNDPLGLKIHIFKDIKSKVGIQAAEWILSHMLEISHARSSNGAPKSPPAGPQGQLGVPGALREAARGGQNDPRRPKKHCSSI